MFTDTRNSLSITVWNYRMKEVRHKKKVCKVVALIKSSIYFIGNSSIMPFRLELKMSRILKDLLVVCQSLFLFPRLKKRIEGKFSMKWKVFMYSQNHLRMSWEPSKLPGGRGGASHHHPKITVSGIFISTQVPIQLSSSSLIPV